MDGWLVKLSAWGSGRGCITLSPIGPLSRLRLAVKPSVWHESQKYLVHLLKYDAMTQDKKSPSDENARAKNVSSATGKSPHQK